jgi:ParB family chromosome partitioning protein
MKNTRLKQVERMTAAAQGAPSFSRTELAMQLAGGTHPKYSAEDEPAARSPQPDAGRIENIPLSLIDENPFNARRVYRSDRVSELARSIRDFGQDTPAIVTPRNGRYTLGAGHYRMKAIASLGATEMAVIVRPHLSDKDLYEVSYRENAEREPQTALDDAYAWTSLIEKGIYRTDEELAVAIGVSPATIHKASGILALPKEVLDEVELSPASYPGSVLYELSLWSKVFPCDVVLEQTRRVRDKEVTRRELETLRKSRETPEPKGQKVHSRQHKCFDNEIAIGVLKEWDSGRIILELEIADPIKKQQFISEMRLRFNFPE